MNNTKKLTSEELDEIHASMKVVAEKLKTGLGISVREKEEILKAMSLTPGHWFKCPNGHYYAMGECGGATHESRCNECHARIGGSNHRCVRTMLLQVISMDRPVPRGPDKLQSKSSSFPFFNS